MSHFSGHFEGASTFLTSKLSLAHCATKKNYVPQFLKQRDINSYYGVLCMNEHEEVGIILWDGIYISF
jgi:hypothetical protein